MMHVAPSAVLYTLTPETRGLESLTTDLQLEELSKRLLANSEGLRLQVVEKDGRYFSLNNTRLQVCRWLENRGHLSTVQAETVPLAAVPEGIKRWMLAPPTDTKHAPPCCHESTHKSESPTGASAEETVMTITYEPMERRPRTAAHDNDDDDDDDRSDSDDSECDESDSSPDEFELRDQQSRRRRQSDDYGEEEDASLL